MNICVVYLTGLVCVVSFCSPICMCPCVRACVRIYICVCIRLTDKSLFGHWVGLSVFEIYAVKCAIYRMHLANSVSFFFFFPFGLFFKVKPNAFHSPLHSVSGLRWKKKLIILLISTLCFISRSVLFSILWRAGYCNISSTLCDANPPEGRETMRKTVRSRAKHSYWKMRPDLVNTCPFSYYAKTGGQWINNIKPECLICGVALTRRDSLMPPN